MFDFRNISNILQHEVFDYKPRIMCHTTLHCNDYRETQEYDTRQKVESIKKNNNKRLYVTKNKNYE